MRYTLTFSRTLNTWYAHDSDGQIVASATLKEDLLAFLSAHGWKPVEVHYD